MSTKSTRSGGKFSGAHTTVTPTAARIADIAHRCDEVTRITPGFIKSGLSSPRGGERVKIGFGENGHILLQVRGNTSQQELHVQTRCPHTTKLAVARSARASGISIAFEKKA